MFCFVSALLPFVTSWRSRAVVISRCSWQPSVYKCTSRLRRNASARRRRRLSSKRFRAGLSVVRMVEDYRLQWRRLHIAGRPSRPSHSSSLLAQWRSVDLQYCLPRSSISGICKVQVVNLSRLHAIARKMIFLTSYIVQSWTRNQSSSLEKRHSASARRTCYSKVLRLLESFGSMSCNGESFLCSWCLHLASVMTIMTVT